MIKLFFFTFSVSAVILTFTDYLSKPREISIPYSNIQPEIFDLKISSKLSNVSETELEYNFDYENLLKHLNLDNKNFPFFGLPFITRQYSSRGIFRSLADFVFSYKYNNLDPIKVKCGDIIFVKTDYIIDFVENYHPLIAHPYILITHESNIAVGTLWQLKYLNDKKVIAWFAQNALTKHPKLRSIPLGIVPPPHENFSTVYNVARDHIPYSKKRFLIYLNFSLHTNKNRIKTLEYFQKTFANNSNVLIDTGRISWKDYLMKMRDSQFVLSPPGSGVDCYRTWEALMVGSVPIVLKSGLEPVYGDMPVMVVNDWTEVTEENMKKFQQEKLSNFSKDGFPWRPKIWLRHWIKEILTTKLNYIKNFC